VFVLIIFLTFVCHSSKAEVNKSVQSAYRMYQIVYNVPEILGYLLLRGGKRRGGERNEGMGKGRNDPYL